jgi:hypothetical protein
MAEPISLLASSGSEQLDQITHGVIEALELHFPDRIRGYYFEGSCADGAFGYAGHLLKTPDGTLTPSTKRIVHASGYIATALLALRTPIFVADKRTAISAHQQHIDDVWAEHRTPIIPPAYPIIRSHIR